MTHTRIAVIDIGKTNAKLALIDAGTLSEIAVTTRPNKVLPGPPWPHFDLEGHWTFLLDGLRDMHAAHGIDAISVTTHGASGVLLDAEGGLAAPMLDYEHDGPDAWAAEYDALRPSFAETGSPRLPQGLNLGAQFHYMLATDPGLAARIRHVVTYPQYWGFRLTGEVASDVTSLGCHTDLWNPWEVAPSPILGRLGLDGRLAPARKSTDILGPITADVARRTGLSPDTPVACGIHDSNASLYPHLLAREAPFAVVSTGTWVVAMAVGGTDDALDPARDTLVNVDARGGTVPSARFMGGREYEMIRDGSEAEPGEADRAAVLAGLYLLPTISGNTGPFPGRRGGFTHDPPSEAARMLALSYYLALMTQTCLELIGARGRVIVEGPFASNRHYLDMLSALRPGEVEATVSATGTSVGGALLFAAGWTPPPASPLEPSDPEALRRYAESWRSRVENELPMRQAST
ncbi:sugar (pentulose or hexulose) kinase [Palleronia aestuarii]|uniref:Sugar (Pentulose or hexulose) kinase n=1 Tax=Palleronia aestuarii TaxID=568105 RepID=A0A2W7NKR9_9RHOB|nr:FGGY-family carbohydrate kinase [Palleronia aestuarii]PZX13786.1 sugar (pentulose or hexulose) kinase [Palleronia aestuarii]